MATVVAGSIERTRCLYPWDEWLDGNQRELEHGVDFKIPLERFRIGAYNAARKRGLQLLTRTRVRDDGVTVLRIQAHRA